MLIGESVERREREGEREREVGGERESDQSPHHSIHVATIEKHPAITGTSTYSNLISRGKCKRKKGQQEKRLGDSWKPARRNTLINGGTTQHVPTRNLNHSISLSLSLSLYTTR